MVFGDDAVNARIGPIRRRSLTPDDAFGGSPDDRAIEVENAYLAPPEQFARNAHELSYRA
jgi:hypothetical protein